MTFFFILQEREKQNQEEKAFEKQIKSEMKKKEQTLRAQLKVFSFVNQHISNTHISSNSINTINIFLTSNDLSLDNNSRFRK